VAASPTFQVELRRDYQREQWCPYITPALLHLCSQYSLLFKTCLVGLFRYWINITLAIYPSREGLAGKKSSSNWNQGIWIWKYICLTPHVTHQWGEHMKCVCWRAETAASKVARSLRSAGALPGSGGVEQKLPCRTHVNLIFQLFFQNSGGRKFTVAIFCLFFILFFICFYHENIWVGGKNSWKTKWKTVKKNSQKTLPWASLLNGRKGKAQPEKAQLEESTHKHTHWTDERQTVKQQSTARGKQVQTSDSNWHVKRTKKTTIEETNPRNLWWFGPVTCQFFDWKASMCSLSRTWSKICQIWCIK